MNNIRRINPLTPETSIINEAASIIMNGGVVAFPTETVYGLGADSTNDEAIKNIFRVKGRPEDNPLIAHVASVEQAKSIVRKYPMLAEKLSEAFWPGPLTIVLQKNSIVSDTATCGLDTVAVRMPKNKIALELIKACGVPVVAPSANLSGKPSPTTAEHVANDIGEKIEMIIDGGETQYGIESTVVDLTGDLPAILRIGSISPDEIKKIIGEVKLFLRSEKPASPGMKYKHYSPLAEIILVDEPDIKKKIMIEATSFASKKIRFAIMTFDEYIIDFEKFNVTTLSDINSPGNYMRKLYAAFRSFDENHVEKIIVHHPPSTDKWLAIIEKLHKAASREL